MLSKWQWILLQITRKLWVRASLFAVLAVISALAATVIGPFIPYKLSASIGADAVDDILKILASSMLAVTTFSLSVMVTHYSSVTSNVTPRATRLLLQDSTAQNALGTFIGSFLFSLVGIIALSTGAYGERGRVILFAVTTVVVLLIVLTMLRWIDHLSSMGRIEEPTERVEDATRSALAARGRSPTLGARPLGSVPPDAVAIYPDRVGYVQHLAMSGLADIAEDHAVDIYINAPPGRFVHPRFPLAWVNGNDIEEARTLIASSFSIDDLRTYDSDPRFGLSVLAEIASRALSPGINDPGTAIDIIGRGVRVLAEWHATAEAAEDGEQLYSRIWIARLETDDLFEDMFTPIARDGAGFAEVQIRLQKAFTALAEIGGPEFAACAYRQSEMALKRSETALHLEEEKDRVRAVAMAAKTPAPDAARP